MNVIRIRDSGAFRPLHVVMTFLVAATVAGGCFLLSAAQSTILIDGAIEWQAESPLRAVVQTLCLNYKIPTIHPGEIKGYLLGIGAGLAVLSLAVAIFAKSRTGDEEEAGDGPAATAGRASGTLRAMVHIGPLAAAQVLVGLFLLWSFASSRWSSASDIAIGGSVLMTIQFLWAFGIGHGLGPRGARIASRIVLALLAASAATAVWYYYGRNPVLSAKFPFGNPTFLAACLIPGILLGAALILEAVVASLRAKRISSVAPAAAAVVAVAVCLWAFYLARSRGPAVGLVFGVVALVFFVVRGRWKLVPCGVGLAIAVAGWLYVSANLYEPSPTGRSATMRFRLYSWDYAWRMFLDKPLNGYGQGGFTLSGDSHVAGDILADPLPFVARIAHVHNEWLEVMADLGAVGIILIVSALLLTLIAGMHALEKPIGWRDRWVLLGCMSALVGLVVEECFGVGLRVSEVPTLFLTLVGFIWALAGPPRSALVGYASATSGRRMVAGVIGGVLGVSAMAITQQDFAAARDAYRTDVYLREGDDEGATRAASLAILRLNPQRTLTNRYRLGETHLVLADRLLQRALDRHRRATESAPPNPRLQMLAEQDFAASEQRCKAASRELKELVSRSPGFINQGWLEYRINMVLAQIAAAGNEKEAGEAFTRNAAAALERERRRQPFVPRFAVEYLYVAADQLTLEQIVDVLARPLRHNRLTDAYVEVINRLDRDPELDTKLKPTLESARQAIDETKLTGAGDVQVDLWSPEKLRLAAALYFLRGEFSQSVDNLETASMAYDRLATAAPTGAAACYAELADARFYNDPDAPDQALESAKRALTIVPSSLEGRRLAEVVEQRMIQYHLARGDETEATRLLEKSAPPGATPEAVQAELGVRLRRLCESLITRRRESLAAQEGAGELLQKLRQWLKRAVELAPFDPATHYLAADLALFAEDEGSAVEHMRRALDVGLPPEDARRFIEAASKMNSDSPALKDLLETIDEAERSDSGAQIPPRLRQTLPESPVADEP